MASLFGRNKLKEKAKLIPTSQILPHIQIIKNWQKDYHNGTLKQDKETSREQSYNQDFFIKILGYKQKPAAPFSFEPKATTQKGQLPDAIISYNGENISAVVELKGAGIALDRPQQREGNMSPVAQAFKYKTQVHRCPFVIVSNFYELRLYQDNQLDYEIWTLDDLANPADDYQIFKGWYVLLNSNNFISKDGISPTEKLLSEVRIDQEEISKKFYAEYKEARRELLREMWRKNSGVKQNIDFGIEKAQKIIDRIVFVCFAEDKGLLPDNILHQVIEYAQKSTVDVSLWNALKGFFEKIDKGSMKLEIPKGYNGGLFKTDTDLNALEIGDDALKKITALAKYDFKEDLSVSILGHIFEQSISDLEEIKSRVNKSKNLDDIAQSRRKKDGIYYTPDYIVRYIVDNSLGAYLQENEQKIRQEFGLKAEIKSAADQKRQQKAYAKYQTFLQNIKVLDPACGSGAFLVYVFDFLLAENKRVGEILGDLFSLETYVRDILQNNIYGVDLNDESVEITKLSLWLKTAQKGKKLTALDKNIRCGNSLIDDENIAGRKAFNWQKEFKEIFENGGFDVVVGNPPYFNIQTLGAHSREAEFIQNKFSQIWQDKSDILFYFFYLALKISKGAVGFITSNAYLFSDKAQKLRNFIIEDGRLKTIVNFEKHLVFADASITSCISIFNKNKKDTCAFVLKDKNYESDKINNIINNPQNSFKVSLKSNDVFALVDNRISKLNAKIDGRHPKLQNIIKMGKGMETAANEVFLFNDRPSQFPQEFIKKRMIGENIYRYFLGDKQEYLLYFEDVENFDDLPQSIQEHLKNNEDELKNRATVKNEGRAWWRYSRPMHRELYYYDKIWCSYRAIDNEFVLDRTGAYIGLTNTTVIFGTNEEIDLRYLLALLNSKILRFRYRSIGKQTGGGVYEYVPNSVGKLPIVVIDLIAQKPIIELVDKLMNKINERQKIIETFGGLLVLEFNLKKLSPNWWTLKFPDFVLALKVKLSLTQKDELLQLFNKYQPKLAALSAEIKLIDDEIDQLVYKLYNLTAEEIKTVESNL